LVFEERGNRSSWRKPLGAEKRTNKLSPHLTPDLEIEPRATLVGGECSHHCAIPAPLIKPLECTEMVTIYFGIVQKYIENSSEEGNI